VILHLRSGETPWFSANDSGNTKKGEHTASVVAAAAIAGPAKLVSKNGPMQMEKFDNVIKINLYGTLPRQHWWA